MLSAKLLYVIYYFLQDDSSFRNQIKLEQVKTSCVHETAGKLYDCQTYILNHIATGIAVTSELGIKKPIPNSTKTSSKLDGKN